MNKNLIIKKIKERAKIFFKNDFTGHDWWHSWRVWKLAKKIAQKEGGDLFVIELAALLHDVEDWKFSDRKNLRANLAKKWLKQLKINKNKTEHICHIVENVSFKGAEIKNKIKTKEGMIVQDADRLDAIGAIAIARVFMWGGYAKREMHNPNISPKKYKTFKQYKNSKSTSINHFYEKLLLLKDRLNTKTAKKIAIKRHKFMEKFLRQFFNEWNNKL